MPKTFEIVKLGSSQTMFCSFKYNYKQECLLVEGSPQLAHRKSNTYKLTLTWRRTWTSITRLNWCPDYKIKILHCITQSLWHSNLTWIWSRCTTIPKMKFLCYTNSKVIAWTDTHRERQTHRQYENITLPVYAGGNKNACKLTKLLYRPVSESFSFLFKLGFSSGSFITAGLAPGRGSRYPGVGAGLLLKYDICNACNWICARY